MNVSSRVDLAVRALTRLADPSGRPTTLARLAESTACPPLAMSRLLGEARRARLVAVVRGPRGGYLLSRPARSITVGDVARAVDGRWATVGDGWPDGPVASQAPAPTRTVWVALFQSMSAVLDTVTLEHLRLGHLPVHVEALAGVPEPSDRG